MQFGVMTLGDLITDPVTGERQSPAERHRSIVHQAVTAEAVGFDSYHVGEHHFCEYITSAPPVILAAIAERTTTLRLSTGVTLGTNLDPVRLAEDYATVDVLSGGRAEPVIGRGTFFPHTFAAFGQDPTVSKAQFAENVELVMRLWSEEDVTWSGEHRGPLDGVTIHPRPVQSPPMTWIGGGASSDSVTLAARLGLGLMLPIVFGTVEAFRPVVDSYREQWAAFGHDPADARVGTCTHAHVGPDATAALATWRPRFQAYLEWVGDLITRSTGQSASGGLWNADIDGRLGDIAICAGPQQAIEQMAWMHETLGLDTQILMLDMGGMPREIVQETIARIGEDVLPAFT